MNVKSLTHLQNMPEQIEQNHNKHQGTKQKEPFHKIFCSECSFTSSTKQALYNHDKIKHNGLSYKCNKCDHQTISQAVFSTHNKKNH